MTSFDALAPRYDDWCQTPLGALTEASERAVLMSLLPRPMAAMRVLDIGSGTGTWAIHLSALGAVVTGLDLSPAMVQVAQAKARQAGAAVTFQGGDAGVLPFPDASFDLVTVLLVLEFAPNPEAILAEATRVLRPDGTAIVTALNRRSIWTVLRRRAGRRRPTVYSGARFRTRRELGALLTAAGLTPVAYRAAVWYPPLRGTWSLPLLRSVEKAGQHGWGVGPAFLAVKAIKRANGTGNQAHK